MASVHQQRPAMSAASFHTAWVMLSIAMIASTAIDCRSPSANTSQTNQLASGPARGKPDAPVKDDGPSLAETAEWIKSEGPGLMRAFKSKVDHRYGTATHSTERANDVAVQQCTLLWTETSDFELNDGIKRSKSHYESRVAVPLKDLDLGAIAVGTDTFMSDEPVFLVQLKTRAAAGATIVEKRKGKPDGASGAAQIYVSNQNAGERVANAVKRAATLCGAPRSAF